MPPAPFLPQRLIRLKRDGGTLTAADIERFVAGLTRGEISAEQVAALAMAVFFRGLDSVERRALTLAMARSGQVLRWPCDRLRGPVLDKHSTGGVGDKVSLILAPLVAACGAHVPMISGRGLGHTGGTLDKLESIPGYRTALASDEFMAQVIDLGCAIVGQTAELAPADRRFYAIRDVTATVESIPLITASILAKKLAAGLDGLVLDVKFGSGAMMPDRVRAAELAAALTATAGDCGLRARAVLGDMNQVLGRTAGNALEVGEAVAVLTGAGAEPRLLDCTLTLAAEMLVQGGLAPDHESGRHAAAAALAAGKAAETFGRMVRAQGGPADFIDRPGHYLAAAPVIREVTAGRTGYLAEFDVRAIGEAIVTLGGGRTKTEQRIDPRVGFSDVAALGTRLDTGEPLARVHAADDAAAQAAIAAFDEAIEIGDRAPEPGPVAVVLDAMEA